VSFEFALLFRTIAISDYCAGVLVRPDAVLTAGHCPPPAGFQVTNSAGHVVYRRVLSCVLHPDGAAGAGRDAALCALEPGGTEGYAVAALATMSYTHVDSQKAVVVRPRRMARGGNTDMVGLETELSLHDVDYEATPDVYCQGDSGAPAFVSTPDAQHVLGGILSYSRDPAQRECSQGPAFFTTVASLEPWLSSVLDGPNSMALPRVSGPTRSSTFGLAVVVTVNAIIFIALAIGLSHSRRLQRERGSR
jgi:Trypsin